MGFDHIGETPTHAARFGFLDVVEILFTGDKHRGQDHKQLRSLLSLKVVLEHVAKQWDVGHERDATTSVEANLLNQTSEDHGLSTVGCHNRLSGGSTDVVDQHDVAGDVTDGDNRSVVFVSLGASGIDVHDDQSIRTDSRTNLHDQTDFDVLGHDLRSGDTVVDHTGHSGNLSTDLDKSRRVVHRGDLRTAEDL